MAVVLSDGDGPTGKFPRNAATCESYGRGKLSVLWRDPIASNRPLLRGQILLKAKPEKNLLKPFFCTKKS
jgi:hypothetical protein